MPEPLSPAKRVQLRADHRPFWQPPVCCRQCSEDWPCSTIQALEDGDYWHAQAEVAEQQVQTLAASLVAGAIASLAMVQSAMDHVRTDWQHAQAAKHRVAALQAENARLRAAAQQVCTVLNDEAMTWCAAPQCPWCSAYRTLAALLDEAAVPQQEAPDA